MAKDIHQHTEGQGLYVLSFFDSAGEVSPVFEKKARELFSEYNLEDVQPNEFYSGAKISDAFFDVVNEVGEKTMRQGGVQMGKDVPWPDGVDTPHEGLTTINAVHQEAARSTGTEPGNIEYPAGQYTYEQTGPSAARVGITENYPYPEVMAEGVFVGIVDGLGGSSPDIESADARDNEISAWSIEW